MTTPTFAYSVVNGVRIPAKNPPPPAVRWHRKGCPTCKPITVPTRTIIPSKP